MSHNRFKTLWLNRREVAAVFHRYWTVWKPSSLHQLTIRLTSLQTSSRVSWTRMEWQRTEKSIRVRTYRSLSFKISHSWRYRIILHHWFSAFGVNSTVCPPVIVNMSGSWNFSYTDRIFVNHPMQLDLNIALSRSNAKSPSQYPRSHMQVRAASERLRRMAEWNFSYCGFSNDSTSFDGSRAVRLIVSQLVAFPQKTPPDVCVNLDY